MITIAIGIVLAIFAIELAGRILAGVVGVLQVVFDAWMDWMDGVSKAPTVRPDPPDPYIGTSRAERAAYMEEVRRRRPV